MNVAKKSTSKQRINGNSIHNNAKAYSEKYDTNLKDTDDVIICESPPSVTNNGIISDYSTDSIKNRSKRSSDLRVDQNNSKKLKTSDLEIVAPNSLNYPVFSIGKIQAIIQDEIKKELRILQDELSAKYAKEILDLKMTINFWKSKAQELKEEFFAFKKHKEESSLKQVETFQNGQMSTSQMTTTIPPLSKVNNAAIKNGNSNNKSPCFLPPASANATLSLHLKNLHNNKMNNASNQYILIDSTANINSKKSQPSSSISMPSTSHALSNDSKNNTLCSGQSILASYLHDKQVIDLTDDLEDNSSNINNTNSNKNNCVNSNVNDDKALVTPTNIIVANKHNIFHNINSSNVDNVKGSIAGFTNTANDGPTYASTSKLSPKMPSPPPLLVNQHAPPDSKNLPSKPILEYNIKEDEIELKWTCDTNIMNEDAVSYHLFSCHDKTTWKRVGTISAMPLPMACVLEKSKINKQIFFVLRGIDKHGRVGPFSDVIYINQDDAT